MRCQKNYRSLKPQPFYVSDAMPQDIERTLTAFDTANEETHERDLTRKLAERLHAHLKSKRLELRVHWFYPTSLHFYEMPDDLLKLFSAADFTILKGDVNYRRLIGDAHWKPTIAFNYTTRYFPTPLCRPSHTQIRRHRQGSTPPRSNTSTNSTLTGAPTASAASSRRIAGAMSDEH